MKQQMWKKILQFATWKDQRGQDMVEYALLAGFIAIAAGAIFPPASSSISTIFSRMASIMNQV
jgi:pilus assembly protein Flp/PilA